jgi:hypothetical protein
MIRIESIDLAGTLLAALLTIMVLSYLIGDNPLYRIASHIFIGVAAGYAGAAAWHYVLQPDLLQPLFAVIDGRVGLAGIDWIIQLILALIPLVLSFLLLLKGSPTYGRLGTIPLAIMTGVGAAVVIGGSLTGTLLSQVGASFVNLNPAHVNPVTGEQGFERLLNVIIVIVGTISTLIYFQFSIRKQNAITGERTKIIQVISKVGSGFIAITFGVIYAGVLLASIVVLAERIRFLVDVVFQFVFTS